MTRREELASLPLHDRIAAVIRDSGLGQDAFATELGLATETVSRWVNRHTRPGREGRQLLADRASRIYDEPIPPDLFREVFVDRANTEDTLMLVARSIDQKLELLAELLAEQRDLVETMLRVSETLSRLANVLEQSRDPSRPDEAAP